MIQEPAGLYVHVPFCRTKCRYCDFYSETDLDAVSPWFSAALAEADLYREICGAFDTLYLGGGTPSLLPARLVESLLRGLRWRFSFGPGTEITLEANPDDVTAEKLRAWRAAGVNRLSLGVQSFDDKELRFLGRRHGARCAMEALDLARKAGFSNVGIDLIWGLPGQSLSQWMTTLEEALAFSPEHLSCYELTVEEGTRLHEAVTTGAVVLPAEADLAERFLATSERLTVFGYDHYEVSNFARTRRHRSRHNQKYWRHVPYLGLGPSAHSFMDGRRWWNVRSLHDYIRRLQWNISPVAGDERLTGDQLRLETLYLGFRTSDGITRRELGEGPEVESALEALRRSGNLEVVGDRVRATLTGWLMADRLPSFFDP